MTKEALTNPYEAAKSVGSAPAKKPRRPTARWLAVPFFAIGGGMFAAVATFIVVEVFSSGGDFAEMIAIGFAFIALVVGGLLGSIVGVGFARGTHLD